MKCEKAGQYYFSYLDDRSKEKIPQAVQAHISQCSYCHKKIHGLKQVANGDLSSYPDEVSHVMAINSLLASHLKYAETPVTCAMVQRFLPGLVSQDIKITVPTPITLHVEQCSTCRKNWLELQSLSLSNAQLQRLTQCLEDGRDTSALMVSHLSDKQVPLFAHVKYADCDVSHLEHVCLCVSCRQRILTIRQTGVPQSEVDTTSCDDILYRDLFDLALPLGFNPLADEHAKDREATIEHICHCETCMKRLGVLDQLLINLLSPYDSGIVTNFHLDLDKTQVSTDDEHAKHPIQDDIQKVSGLAASKARQKTRALSTPVRACTGWMKIAAVVAVLLGVTIFSIIPKAGAGFLDQVYEATTNVPVVHITVSKGDDSTVLTEHWLFPPDRAVTTEGQTKTVYNVKAGLVRKTDAAGNQSKTPLNREGRESLQQQIRGLFYVWPLERAQSAILTSQETDDLDVYSLQWSQDKRVFLWRAYVDHNTQRVQKVDRFSGNTTTSLGKTHSFDVDYPTPEEAETFLKQLQILIN
ncbi:MAG: hypothetical protein K9N55_10110 [Phycisphaerae bacterium]|nr:hypothetical protein [Phycisphaerae bacterium]